MRTLVVVLLLSCSAWASVSFTNLDHKQISGPVNNIVSNSITPPSNNLVLVAASAILNTGNGPGAISTITGNSLTYVLVLALDFGPPQGTARTGRLEVWRGLGASPSTGAVTVTWGTSPTSLGVTISQASGVNTSGSNGSGAIGISASDANGGGSSTPATVTMGTFASSSNGTYGLVAATGGATITAGSGMALLGLNASSPTEADEWAVGNISPVQFNFSVPQSYGIIGLEIKASVSPGRKPIMIWGM